MPPIIQNIGVKNFRCLRDISVAMNSINVLFGANGVGKSSFLDALWFIRDCAIRGTDQAASDRHHGIGILWDGAGPEDRIQISIETSLVEYTIMFGYSSGRIEPFVGETLISKGRDVTLLDRKIGSDTASFYHETLKQIVSLKLREPEKLAFTNYLLLCEVSEETNQLDEILRSIHFYGSRSVDLFRLRRLGSDSSQHTFLWDRWQNLWSALRNLHDRRAMDERYGTIIKFMRQAFPKSFKDIVFEQVGADRVSATFIEEGRRQPIQASGVSDGHLQFLGLLVALFGNSSKRFSVLLFDEPEISLHPHAIAIFAEALKYATRDFSHQVFIATHSPVLMSQFDSDEAFVMEEGKERDTLILPVSQKAELKDLLDQYALGSIFMAEEIARQSIPNGNSIK